MGQRRPGVATRRGRESHPKRSVVPVDGGASERCIAAASRYISGGEGGGGGADGSSGGDSVEVIVVVVVVVGVLL